MGIDFDFLIDNPTLKDLKKLSMENKYFMDASKLKDLVQREFDMMKHQFRKEENDLDKIYNSKLDPRYNQSLNDEFIRIQKYNYTYFGHLDENSKQNGLGTKLYENGFCYQGMFENDQCTGFGVSKDQNGVRYIGEHKDGKRDGFGTLIMRDNTQYICMWKDNRLHGRGFQLKGDQKYMIIS